MELRHEEIRQLGSSLLLQLVERFSCHVGDRVAAEVGHDRAALVERIPESTGPIRPRGRRKTVRPFPSQHALAVAADRFEEKEIRWISRLCPIVEFLQLRRASDKRVRAEVVRLGIERGRFGNVFPPARSWRGLALLRSLGRCLGLGSLFEMPPQLGNRRPDLLFEIFEALENRVDPLDSRIRRHLLGSLTKRRELRTLLQIELDVAFPQRVVFPHDEQQDRRSRCIAVSNSNSVIETPFELRTGSSRICPYLRLITPIVGRTVTHHFERRIDHVHQPSRVVLHRIGVQPVLMDRPDERLAMLDKVREGARHHHLLNVTWLRVAGHGASRREIVRDRYPSRRIYRSPQNNIICASSPMTRSKSRPRTCRTGSAIGRICFCT